MIKYDDIFINELKKRKNIITNSDIDGVLSASLLCYYFSNLSLKGFTNSATNVWVTNDVKKENSLYVDIYMTNDNTFTVDNHIINTINTPINNSLKVNPNLVKGVTLENYSNKYPFSTFIFILHILEKHFKIEFIELDKIIGYVNQEPLYLWELILRADDTLLNSYKYKKNTDIWWNWLCNDNNGLLLKLYNKIKQVGTKENSEMIKNKVQTFLFNMFNLKSDGYKCIDDKNFEPFVKFISKSLGFELSKPIDLINIEFNLKRYQFSDNKNFDIKKIQEIYDIISLSFISHNILSFSYINKKKFKI